MLLAGMIEMRLIRGNLSYHLFTQISLTYFLKLFKGQASLICNLEYLIHKCFYLFKIDPV